MAITFTWSVKDLHKVTATGAVYKVDWSCSGVDTDTEVSHSRSGSYLHTHEVDVAEVTVTVDEVTETVNQVTGQDDDGNDVTESVTRVATHAHTVVTPAHTEIVPVIPDHTASGFVAYDALDEATVLGWIQANGVQAYNEGLITSNITNKIAASANSTGMPWAAK
jgi:hypothetical protein